MARCLSPRGTRREGRNTEPSGIENWIQASPMCPCDHEPRPRDLVLVERVGLDWELIPLVTHNAQTVPHAIPFRKRPDNISISNITRRLNRGGLPIVITALLDRRGGIWPQEDRCGRDGATASAGATGRRCRRPAAMRGRRAARGRRPRNHSRNLTLESRTSAVILTILPRNRRM